MIDCCVQAATFDVRVNLKPLRMSKYIATNSSLNFVISQYSSPEQASKHGIYFFLLFVRLPLS